MGRKMTALLGSDHAAAGQRDGRLPELFGDCLDSLGGDGHAEYRLDPADHRFGDLLGSLSRLLSRRGDTVKAGAQDEAGQLEAAGGPGQPLRGPAQVVVCLLHTDTPCDKPFSTLGEAP
jgi:hypothetical protein